MRLPYVDDDPQMSTEEEQEIVNQVKERRGGKLLELDKALLHAPHIALGWNSFLGAVRTQNSLPASLRELAMCRVAVLNSAWYEWDHHRPLLAQSGALSEEVIEKIKLRDWDGHGLDEKHLAVLHYTDAMTIGCIVKDPLYANVKGLFSEQEVVEISATIAAYNCVSRFLIALDVGETAAKYNIDMS